MPSTRTTQWTVMVVMAKAAIVELTGGPQPTALCSGPGLSWGRGKGMSGKALRARRGHRRGFRTLSPAPRCLLAPSYLDTVPAEGLGPRRPLPPLPWDSTMVPPSNDDSSVKGRAQGPGRKIWLPCGNAYFSPGKGWQTQAPSLY